MEDPAVSPPPPVPGYARRSDPPPSRGGRGLSRPVVALILLGCAVGGGTWKLAELRRFADASSKSIVAQARAESRGPDLRLVLVQMVGRAHAAADAAEPRWDGVTDDDLAAYKRALETRRRLDADLAAGSRPNVVQILKPARLGTAAGRAGSPGWPGRTLGSETRSSGA